METTFSLLSKGVIILDLETGEDILKSIEKVIKEKKIKNAIVLTGTGSLSKIHYHTIVKEPNKSQPVKEIYREEEDYIEIFSIQGTIIDEEPHIHLNCSINDEIMLGGHLELGCEVLTGCEICILPLQNINLKRIKNKFGWAKIKEVL